MSVHSPQQIQKKTLHHSRQRGFFCEIKTIISGNRKRLIFIPKSSWFMQECQKSCHLEWKSPVVTEEGAGVRESSWVPGAGDSPARKSDLSPGVSPGEATAAAGAFNLSNVSDNSDSESDNSEKLVTIWERRWKGGKNLKCGGENLQKGLYRWFRGCLASLPETPQNCLL